MAKMPDFADILASEMQKQVEEPIYCRYCGRDVKVPRKEAGKDWKQNMDWEVRNYTHTNCHRKHLYGGR